MVFNHCAIKIITAISKYTQMIPSQSLILTILEVLGPGYVIRSQNIWEWAITRHISVFAVFIPGSQNTVLIN